MNLTTQLQLSVLSAPIEATDRRSLSQAWYSALYHGPAAGHRRPPGTAGYAHPRCSRQTTHRSDRDGFRLHRPPASTLDRKDASPPRAAIVERRSLRSTLSRKIERAFSNPVHVPKRQTFELDGQRGRVCVMLQTHGKRVTLVAICAKRAEAAVARALCEARYALAACGVALNAIAKEHAGC